MKFRTIFSIVFGGLLAACSSDDANEAISTELADSTVITVPDGFELDELYAPSDRNMGTWVSLAEGSDGVMYACDQHGGMYQFPIPAIGEGLDSTIVDSVELDLGYAHGMLWAHNSLYIAVNRKWSDTIDVGSGVYRAYDRNNDGKLDDFEMLLKLDGFGEHGPHSFVPDPDGQHIYFIAGNHTLIPQSLLKNSRVPINWGEDNLLPPYLDARGHATEVTAPGGWIARLDPEGKDWELISVGYRNAFDMAFNQTGELFAFDADMEWDMGMPWYRPIRICHVTSGSEYGWRTGTGKWPTYYPDALPAVVDLGQGSPTAVLHGKDWNVPGKYKNGLFVADWSFGTMYFVDLTPDGSSYKGTKEEFLSGVPLPLTDMIAGSDGHLYFATGGRDLESHFYRLRYTGSDKSQPRDADNDLTTELRQLRRKLESLHGAPSSGGTALAWLHLDHPDRFIRYAARIGLEHLPLEQWEDKVYSELNYRKFVPAAIALARSKKSGASDQLIHKLCTVEWDELNRADKLDLLRGFELALIRMNAPSSSSRQQLIQKIKDIFPSEDLAVNREASEILVFLRDQETTRHCIELMQVHTAKNTTIDSEMLPEEISNRHKRYGPIVQEVSANMPPAEAIFYAVLLSHVQNGWTGALREAYFQWFFEVMSAKGGLSFKSFMEDIRKGAMRFVPEEEKEYYQELSGVFSPGEEIANLPRPEGPGE
ncbi:MAG: heme-binding protein, partial [Saprospiraceae bacterium]|nr:heme-binding protein [Saprospiraceae bacterium]